MEPDETCYLISMQLYLRVSAEERANRWQLREAWDWFELRFRPTIRRHARRMTWLEPEARVQELWLFLIPRLLRLQYDPRRGPLAPCIELLVRHAVSDAQRKAVVSPFDSRVVDVLPDIPGDYVFGLSFLEHQELLNGIHDALSELRAGGGDDHARLIEQHWFGYVSLTAIAAESGRTPAQVRLQHVEARAKLRAILLYGRARYLLPDWVSLDHHQEKPEIQKKFLRS